jgi:hypothetical protein
MIPAPEPAETLNARVRAMPVEELVAFATRGARAQEMLDNIIAAIQPISILAAAPAPIGVRRLKALPPSPRGAVKTGWKKANGQPGAFCQECGAQDGTVQQRRCKACRSTAPSSSVPPSRLNQSKDGVPLNARGTPRPACTGCKVRNGAVRMGRCEDCRKKGVGRIMTGRRYPVEAKTSPPIPRHKPSKIRSAAKKRTKADPTPADSSTPPEKTGVVSNTWLEAFKAAIEKRPTLLGLWGVTATMKLIKAGGRPFYEKLPPALLKEVVE